MLNFNKFCTISFFSPKVLYPKLFNLNFFITFVWRYLFYIIKKFIYELSPLENLRLNCKIFSILSLLCFVSKKTTKTNFILQEKFYFHYHLMNNNFILLLLLIISILNFKIRKINFILFIQN